MTELKPIPFEHFNMNAPEMKFEDSIFMGVERIEWFGRSDNG